MKRLLCVALPLVIPARALAHGARALTPDALWTGWFPEVSALVVLLASGYFYAFGVRALWTHARRTAAISRANVLLFGVGWSVLALATISPLHTLGAALFSAHMIQHELLVAVAAPLLILGKPLVAFAWAMPRTARARVSALLMWPPIRSSWRLARGIAGATVLHAAVLWLWHVPLFYEWSIHSSIAHLLQHATFLASALLFWAAVLPRASRTTGGSNTDLAATAALFGTVLHTGLLGALITFSSRLWYAHYGVTTAPWGLMPMEDQQLAGLIMWIPGSIVYIAAALVRGWRVLASRPGTRRALPAG